MQWVTLSSCHFLKMASSDFLWSRKLSPSIISAHFSPDSSLYEVPEELLDIATPLAFCFTVVTGVGRPLSLTKPPPTQPLDLH